MYKLLFLLLSTLIVGRAETTGVYEIFQEASLSSAVQKITLQQVASGTRDITIVSASMWCDVDTTFTLSVNGTAATATSGTVKKLNAWQQSATAAVWTSSNVGSGTTLRTYPFSAGAGIISTSFYKMVIPRNFGTTGNVTLSTTSITGNCKMSLTWEENK